MPKVTANADRPVTMPNLRIKQLVEQVLDSLPKPHPDTVVEDVFVAIEGEPLWRSAYERMIYESGKPAVTTWASFWIAHAVKRTGDQRETAARSSLIESYSRLTATEKRSGKVKEAEALRAMHDHYLANRDKMPVEIRNYRETIVALIMDGIDTEAAFARALERPAYAW